jgi:hypothetical protein
VTREAVSEKYGVGITTLSSRKRSREAAIEPSSPGDDIELLRLENEYLK